MNLEILSSFFPIVWYRVGISTHDEIMVPLGFLSSQQVLEKYHKTPLLCDYGIKILLHESNHLLLDDWSEIRLFIGHLEGLSSPPLSHEDQK